MATSRFASLNTDEFENILKEKDALNTRKATKAAVDVLQAYLVAKKLSTSVEKLDKIAISEILGKFYLEVRKADGDFYKRGSLVSIRGGINRHLKDTYDGQIDIIKDSEFSRANQSFKAALVQLKKLGKGDVEHHPPVDENDICTLYRSGVFNQNDPQCLQNKVWFELMVYICRRGRENLRDLKKGHFTVGTDSNGCEFVAQAVDELTKKTREDNPASRKDAGRIYATGKEDCPVKSFKKYLERLNPKCESLFQTAKSCASDSGPWYKNMPCGVNTLGSMMSTLSKKAKLSKTYTNHCLLATCISILDSKGFASREICQVSGHANEGSITSYVGRVSDNKKHLRCFVSRTWKRKSCQQSS